MRRSVLVGVGLGISVVAALHVGDALRAPDPAESVSRAGPPDRFTIVPDDYHVPYAGTAEDGHRFFLTDELSEQRRGGADYVALFLWNADGTFDEVRVDELTRSNRSRLVASRLAELGDFELEPIEVAPFTTSVDGVDFGWRVQKHGGEYSITIEPGNNIAYYEPWDGYEYDT